MVRGRDVVVWGAADQFHGGVVVVLRAEGVGQEWDEDCG